MLVDWYSHSCTTINMPCHYYMYRVSLFVMSWSTVATLCRKPAFARTSVEKSLTNQCEIFSWVLSNSTCICSTCSQHRMLSEGSKEFSLARTIRAATFTIVRSYTVASGSAVGWGTALQTGRSLVRFQKVSSTQSFWPHYGLGVDSTSNRNEYQEYFLGVKVAGA